MILMYSDEHRLTVEKWGREGDNGDDGDAGGLSMKTANLDFMVMDIG